MEARVYNKATTLWRVARKLVEACITGAFILGLTFQPASADYTHISSKPEYKLSDDRNVDLLSGQFSLSVSDVQIGDPDGGVTHTILGSGNILWPNSRDSYSVYFYTEGAAGPSITSNLVPGGNTCDGSSTGALIFEGNSSSERFCVRNGVFVSWANRGGTLSYSGGNYTYTDRNGVVFSGGSITYPNGVVKTVYGGLRPTGVVSNAGYQLHYEYDANNNLVSVTAFNASVDYCAPTAATCSFSRPWPTAYYSITGTSGGTDTGVGYLTYDVTLTDQFQRVTSMHRGPGILQITTPESSISANITYSLCDYSGTITSFTSACDADMGPGVTSGSKVGHVVSSTKNGSQTTYAWVVGGVPYTTTGRSTPSSGVSMYRHTVSGCSLWDPCYDSLTLGDGQVVSYDYLNHSRLKKVAYDANITDNYTYDDRENLILTVRDPLSTSGLSSVSSSENYSTSCSNLVTCNKPNYKIDPNGNRTDYEYDPTTGQIIRETGPADAANVRVQTRYAYTLLYAKVRNSAGQLVNATTPISKLTSTSSCRVATNANPASCVGTANETVTDYEYGSNNLLMTKMTVRAGNADVNQVASSSNVWRSTTYSYDDVGNKTSEDGPLPGDVDKIVYRYNSLNQQIGIVGPDPDGTGSLIRVAKRITYNTAGQVRLEESGTLTGQAESDWANFAPASQAETFYDAYGRVGMVKTSAAGTVISVTQTSYDSEGRVQCIATRMNPSIFSSLTAADDACALKTAGQYGNDRIIKNVYDSLNHVIQVIQAYGTTNQRVYASTSYTNLGQVIDTIDANGNRSHNVYDGFDRLSAYYYPSTTRPTAFNASTQATALSTAGAYADATHGSDYEAFTYDNNGNRLTTRRRDGQILTDCYDALNRQIVHYVHSQSGCTATGGAKDVYTTYDLQGHILTKRFASTSGTGVSYAYNGIGQVTSSTDMFNRTVSYQYNQAGARTRLTDNEGYYVAYALDNLNRLTQATLNGTTNVLYGQTFNSLGQRTLLSRGASSAGGSTTYAYDNLSRLQGIAIDTAGTSYDVTWCKVGAVGSVAYNPAGQITNWASSNTIFDYAEIAGTTDARTYDGLNRDAGVAALTGGYDARGNLTTDGTRTFTYDVENRLLTSTGGTNPLTLVYDPEGRLARVTSGSTTKDFLYDGVDLIAEYNSNGTVAARYIHGPGTDDPLVWLQGADDSDRRYYYTNYQGSLIGYTGPTGSFVTSSLTKYGAYGEPRNSNNVESWPASRFGYTGQMVLADARLYYYKARVYDPVFGRFLQTDPIGSKDDLDLYAYVGGDPVNKTDTSGLGQNIYGSWQDATDDDRAAQAQQHGREVTTDRRNAPLVGAYIVGVAAVGMGCGAAPEICASAARKAGIGAGTGAAVNAGVAYVEGKPMGPAALNGAVSGAATGATGALVPGRGAKAAAVGTASAAASKATGGSNFDAGLSGVVSAGVEYITGNEQAANAAALGLEGFLGDVAKSVTKKVVGSAIKEPTKGGCQAVNGGAKC